jgi:cation-transporting ATPase E
MREFTAQAGASAADGRRTLVLAVGTQTNDENVPVDAVPVALVTFREEIRGDAAETLSYFAAQGVEIRILSGDHPQTAAAIARDVGLNAPDGFDARGLPEDDADLLAVLKKYPVFGRVTPEQKRRIIMVLRAAGHVVAMTGDGVNDLPAIKEADIGIAMNSGAASTRAVAKIVLLDGRFSHLPGVVAEGRRVIANIERVSMLFLTKTAYATLLTIAFAIIALPFPFLPRQLSVTDGLTIGIPAFFLALLPNADRYIPGFLRRALTFAIPAGLVIAIALVVYGLVADEMSVATEEMRTGATLILSISGLGVLLVLCNPLTPAKISIVMAMAAGVALAFTMPAVREFFEFSDLSPRSIASVCFVSATALVLILLVRVAMRRIEATRKDSPHHAVRLEHTVTQVDSQPASVREKKARG